MRNLDSVAQERNEFYSILQFGGHFVFFGGHFVSQKNFNFFWTIHTNFHAKSGVHSSKNGWVIALGTKEDTSLVWSLHSLDNIPFLMSHSLVQHTFISIQRIREGAKIILRRGVQKMGVGPQWTKMRGQDTLIHFFLFKFFKKYLKKSENIKGIKFHRGETSVLPQN